MLNILVYCILFPSPFITLGQFATGFYFAWFVVLVPTIGIIENTLMDLANNPSNNSK